MKIIIQKDPISDNTFWDKALDCSEEAQDIYRLMLDDVYFDSKYLDQSVRHKANKECKNDVIRIKSVRELENIGLIRVS